MMFFLVLTIVRAVYIIQTIDNNLHFITDNLGTFKIPYTKSKLPTGGFTRNYCTSNYKITDTTIYNNGTKNNTDGLDVISSTRNLSLNSFINMENGCIMNTNSLSTETAPFPESKNPEKALNIPLEFQQLSVLDKNDSSNALTVFPYAEYNKNITFNENNNQQNQISLAYLSEIDQVEITNDGNIIAYNQKIMLETLYDNPVIVNNICISASKEHIPTMINNAVILLTTINVNIIDLKNICSRNISYSYLTHLFEEYKKYTIHDKTLTIDDCKYTVSEKIVAVYSTKSVKGVNYIVRLYNERPSYMFTFDIYQISAVLILIIALLYFYKGNVRYVDLVENYIFRGLFNNRECLIYQVPFGFFGRNKLNFKNLKDNRLVDIMYEGINKLHYVIITEYTMPYSPYTIKDYQATPMNYDDLHFLYKLENRICLFKKLLFPSLCYWHASERFFVPERSIDVKADILSVVKIIEHLHSLNIVVARICPRNIRVSHNTIKLQSILENVGWKSYNQLRNIRNKKYKPTPMDDIFSLGCVIHYYLTGFHPFDLRNLTHFSRPVSIPKDQKKSSTIFKNKSADQIPTLFNYSIEDSNYVETNIFNKSYKIRLCDQIEHDFIYRCIVDQEIVLNKHPYFWSYKEKIDFICDFSDFIESNLNVKNSFENLKERVFKGNWTDYLDDKVLENISKKRVYDFTMLGDLIRFIRNTQRHLQELSNKSFYQKFEGGVCEYFINIFPELFLVIYKNKAIRKDVLFEKYFN